MAAQGRGDGVLSPSRQGTYRAIDSKGNVLRTGHSQVAENVSADVRQQRDLALFASRAQNCVCDKQGRIQISPQLLAHGGFHDKIVLVGAFWHIQLWTPERWEAANSNDEDYFEVMQRINEMPDSDGGR